MIGIFRLILGVLTLGIIALISAVTTMHFAIHGAEVKTPSLVGLDVTQAAHKTAASGLSLGVDNKYYSADQPSGRVLSQEPAAGTTVRRGWRMRITESLGPQKVSIPSLVGEPERDAAMQVHQLGLELETISQMPFPNLPAGTVIAQSPEAGAQRVAQPAVSLLVSTPSPTVGNAFVMPRLVGMPYAAATNIIAKAGFKTGPMQDVSAPVSDTVADAPPPAPGTIMTQTPAAGDRVDGSTYIALTISQ